MFMNGPAKAMISRCQRGLDRKPRGSSAFSSRWLLAGHLDVAAEQDQRRSGSRSRPRRKPNSRGPKPKLKASTFTSKKRAAQKWPSSWIMIMTPIRTSSHRTFSQRRAYSLKLSQCRPRGPLPVRAHTVRDSRSISRISPIDARLSGRASATVSPATISAIAGKADSALQKRLHRDLIGRIQRAGGRSAGFLALVGQLQQRKLLEIRRHGTPTSGPRAQSILGTGASRRSG